MTQDKPLSPARDVPPARPILVWLGVLFGLIFYGLDAVVDVLVFGEGELLYQLLHPTPIEVWMRATVLVLAVAFGAFADVLVRRQRLAAARAGTAEAFLDSIVDNIPDMVFIKDARDLRFVRVNPAAEKLLGYSRGELTGKTDYDFFSRVQADFFVSKDREALEAGSQLDIAGEEVTTRYRGTRVLRTKKVAIPDETGRPVYLLGISHDITEQKQAEDRVRIEKARAERYLQISRAMIIGLDRDGRVDLINQRGCELLGYTAEEIRGRNWFQTVVPVKARDAVLQVFRQIMTGELPALSHYENEILTKNGDVRHVVWNNTIERDVEGEIVGTLSSGQDITELKRAEEERKRHHEELAHVMRLSSMGELASGMAHELNQPLTALVSYCGTASSMLAKLPSSPPGLVELLERAAEQAHRSGDIIRHLRRFLSKGRIKKVRVDLDAVIREIADFFYWEVRDSPVKIEFRLNSQGRLVEADRVQVEQVLLNLVRNGVEAIQGAGMADGHLVLQTRVLPTDSIEVTVADNGPGVDPVMSGRIFDPFQTTKETGMGMGLSISRSIIDAHGGKLWLADAPGKGAIFGFELPLVGN
jgi:PAS domain S-box-containing protein